jgi:hypothetical protein
LTQKIHINKKFDDGGMIGFGAETPEEFTAIATALVGGEGAADLIALFYELIPASAGSNPNPGPQAPPFEPDVPAEDPAIAAAKAVLAAAGLKDTAPVPATSGGPSCKHGPREYVSGLSKTKFNDDGTPKKWAKWACTVKSRADQCDVVWAK